MEPNAVRSQPPGAVHLSQTTSSLDRWAWLLPVIIVPFVLALPAFSGKVFLFRDIVSFVVPQQSYATEALQHGRFPFWNPMSWGGVPFFAEPGTGLLYPLNAIFHLSPTLRGATLWVLCHLPIAGLGMFLLSRRIGLRQIGASASASLYTASGYLLSLHGSGYYLAAAAWLPFEIAMLLEAATVRSIPRALLAAALVALMLLNGEPQTPLIGCVLATVLVTSEGKRALPGLAWIVGATGFGALLAAIQLVPALEHVRQTVRSAGLPLSEASEFSLHPARWLDFILPTPFGEQFPNGTYWASRWTRGIAGCPWAASLYMGSAAVLLALGSGLRALSARLRVCAAIALPVSLALAAGSFLPFFAAFHRWFPMADRFRYPEKYAIIATIVLALLSGAALDELPTRSGRVFRVSVAASLLFFSAAVLASWPLPWLSMRVTMMLRESSSILTPDAALLGLEAAFTHSGLASAGLAFLALIARRRPRLAVLLSLALVTLDSASQNLNALSYSRGSFASEKPAVLAELNRVVPNWRSGRVIFDDGCTYVGPTEDQQESAYSFYWNIGKQNVTTMFGVRDALGYIPLTPIMPYVIFRAAGGIQSDHAARLLGATARVSCGPTGPNVRAIPNPLSRAAILSPERRSPPQILEALRDPSSDLGALALVERSIERPTPNASGTVVFTEDAPERVALHTAGNGGLLVLRDAFAPGWSGLVDGATAPVFRVNGLWRGIEVPAGEHNVVFQYTAPGFRSGLLISLAACALALIALVLRSTLLRRSSRPHEVL